MLSVSELCFGFTSLSNLSLSLSVLTAEVIAYKSQAHNLQNLYTYDAVLSTLVWLVVFDKACCHQLLSIIEYNIAVYLVWQTNGLKFRLCFVKDITSDATLACWSLKVRLQYNIHFQPKNKSISLNVQLYRFSTIKSNIDLRYCRSHCECVHRLKLSRTQVWVAFTMEQAVSYIKRVLHLIVLWIKAQDVLLEGLHLSVGLEAIGIPQVELEEVYGKSAAWAAVLALSPL